MVRAAIGDRPGLEASGIEIDRGGSSYSIDTVTALKEGTPDAELFLIAGSDVVEDLQTWHRHDELRDMVQLAIVDRPGSVGAQPPDGWRSERVEAPLVDLSSSLLRSRMAEGKSVEYLVPLAALEVWHKWKARIA